MAETTELRVIDLGEYGFTLTQTDFIDGQSRAYSEDGLLHAKTFDALKQLIAGAAEALERPVLSDATDFPDQQRVESWALFTKTPSHRKAARSLRPRDED